MEGKKMAGRRITEGLMPNRKREWYILALEKEKNRLSDLADKIHRDIEKCVVVSADGEHSRVRPVSISEGAWRNAQESLQDAIRKVRDAIIDIHGPGVPKRRPKRRR